MSESIEELRQRWEADPSPQLSIQLAEEYRRLDQREQAAEVLLRSLEENPDHVAARVALGRTKSELGEVDAACELLERVVTEDPTHLVASKLLVGLYLEKGDERQARDRLDLYRLLNEGDPEIETLEARLRQDSTATTLVSGIVDVPRNGDPFQELWSRTDSRGYWQAMGAEGIFPVAGGSWGPTPARSTVDIAAEPEADVTRGATVTLANLYLEQGHLEDARAAFSEVLAGDPQNVAALEGMAAIASQQAEGQNVDESPSAEVVDPGDINARKIGVLRDYLRRIRAASRDR
jgi:Tfp pilus assembly protein PilF